MTSPSVGEAVRSPMGNETLSSRLPRSACLRAPLLSTGSSDAFSLTSKKRLFGETTLRRIALLLRHAAARIEANALEEVMADPVASEFIMTGVGRADDQTVTTSFTTAPAAISSLGNASQPQQNSTSSSGSSAAPLTNVTTAPTVLSSPLVSQLQHVPSLSPPSKLPSLSRRPCADAFFERAINALSTALTSPSYPYSFPEAWFCPVTDTVAAHAARSTRGHSMSASPSKALATPAKGCQPPCQVQAPSSNPNRISSTSYAGYSHSLSLSTLVFLPPPSRACNPDSATRRSLFFSQAELRKVSGVVTAQPPLYFDNMLFDPSTDRYLFDGHAFREEVRVLQVPAGDVCLLERCHVGDTEEESNDAGNVHKLALPCLVLVREYIPISDSCVVLEDEQRQSSARGDSSTAVVVQCISLLPPQLASIRANPYNFLPETAVTQYLLAAAPGCLTVVTPLHTFLYDRESTFFQRVPSPLGHLQGSSQEVGNDAHGPRNPEKVSPMTPVGLSASISSANMSRPNSSLSATRDGGIAVAPSHLVMKGSLSAAEKDRDAGQIALVEERLAQIVLPDVLEEAVGAIQQTLVAYCTQYDLRRHMRASIRAVKVLQRFFRRCLDVKRRAVRRMVQIWRQLEVDARLKLQQYRTLPTAVLQMETVANNILQEHMLTSQSYKVAFIEDQWKQRRRSFAKWKEEEEWGDVFASSDWSKAGGFDGNATVGPAGKRVRSARLSVSEQLRLDSEFKRRSSSGRASLKPLGCRRSFGAAGLHTARQGAAMRRFCSWYIDPQELLYLSHQRLLETLKGSVFRMEEVQLELRRAAHTEMNAGSTGRLASLSSGPKTQQLS